MKLSSRMIIGPEAEPDTMELVRKSMSVKKGQPVGFMVFESTLDDKTVICCLSGGEIRDGEPYFTLVGKAAMEALLNVPRTEKMSLIFQELKLGPTPLGEKMQEAILRAPDGARICFVGDLGGELDGLASQELHVTGEPIVIEP